MGNQQTTANFSEKDVQLLVKLSNKTEEEIRQWYKDFHIESDETDRMNKRQFQLFYTKLRQNPKLQQITDHIFRAFDTNHSGTIDFKEFLLGYIATTTGTNRQKFEYAFDVFDINENDVIEKKEAEKIITIICRILGLSQEDAKTYTETIMLSFDENRDRVVSKEEFIAGCLHDPTLARIATPFDL